MIILRLNEDIWHQYLPCAKPHQALTMKCYLDLDDFKLVNDCLGVVLKC